MGPPSFSDLPIVTLTTTLSKNSLLPSHIDPYPYQRPLTHYFDPYPLLRPLPITSPLTSSLTSLLTSSLTHYLTPYPLPHKALHTERFGHIKNCFDRKKRLTRKILGERNWGCVEVKLELSNGRSKVES